METDREDLVLPGGADRLHARWEGMRCAWIGYRWGGGVGVKSGENCAEVGRRLERRLGSIWWGPVAGIASETGNSAVGGLDGSKVGVS